MNICIFMTSVVAYCWNTHCYQTAAAHTSI